MRRYIGGVRLDGAALGTATIDDVDSRDWIASVRDIVGFDGQTGLVTVYLLDGDRAGAFAVGNLEHRDGYAILRGSTRFGLGRTESGPDVDLGDRLGRERAVSSGEEADTARPDE